ncbi:MAG: hypothetical protein KA511_03495, partial [Brachymonas sp.]|nr:hypothetical protein [Brachymonas sp.]MBP6966406.1 hypothetical protein [Brachymonas sp.]
MFFRFTPQPSKTPPQKPHGPHKASTPIAATSVGTTKGSISSRNTQRRPANSHRASTQATGTPSTSAST